MASRAIVDPRKVRTNLSEPNSTPAGYPDNTAKIEEQDIAVRAYQLWEERGCPAGSDQQDWFQAEKELGTRRSE